MMLPSPITITEALQRVTEHREIFHEEMQYVMQQIIQGKLAPELISALLVGLRVKKETIGEITAAAATMRDFSKKVNGIHNKNNLVDIVGTGGDNSHTFNISTAAMFVVAAAGGIVAKHGNRSVSSQSGSADVLESLGVNIHLDCEQISASINEIGIGFMFAPYHHPAMAQVAGIRKLLGIRTLFNILGPLMNPTNAPNQLMGVFHADLVGIQVRVMQRLGARHALVVHSLDGMDEMSLVEPTLIGELKNNAIQEYLFHPKEYGFNYSDMNTLRVENADASKALLLDALDNVPAPARDITILNAGGALYAANQAASIFEGITMAREAIANGKAYRKLIEFIQFTNQFPKKKL